MSEPYREEFVVYEHRKDKRVAGTEHVFDNYADALAEAKSQTPEGCDPTWRISRRLTMVRL